MKAEDTVMSGEQMSEQIQRKTKKWSIVNPRFIEDIAHIIAQEQAEISFKAGIKEVVNWINSTHLKKTVNYNEPNLIIPLRYWNSKLKEWRI